MTSSTGSGLLLTARRKAPRPEPKQVAKFGGGGHREQVEDLLRLLDAANGKGARRRRH